MTYDELASLSDVYTTLSPDYRKRQTSYILQTLWRDLTSNFDVIGPHFTKLMMVHSHTSSCVAF